MRRGFTLIEVLIGSVVVATVLALSLGLLRGATLAAVRAEERAGPRETALFVCSHLRLAVTDALHVQVAADGQAVAWLEDPPPGTKLPQLERDAKPPREPRDDPRLPRGVIRYDPRELAVLLERPGRHPERLGAGSIGGFSAELVQGALLRLTVRVPRRRNTLLEPLPDLEVADEVLLTGTRRGEVLPWKRLDRYGGEAAR